MRTPDLMRRLDERVGDVVEAALRDHHKRRLRRHGWGDALESRRSQDWWTPRSPVRSGTSIEVLIDGSRAFPAMQEAIAGAQQFVHVAAWHASPDFELTRDTDAVPLRDLLAEVAERAPVRVLMWAGPPLPAFQPSRSVVNAARAEFERDSQVVCVLDRREYTLHCHHEKIVVIDGTTAFVGGLDFTALQGDRHDDSRHPPQTALGWHDAAVRLRGPAVADVARHFVQRWNEVADERLIATPAPPAAGDLDVQVLRTVPNGTYDFAPDGDFGILDAYVHALRRAERFVYLENQFLWSPEIVDILVDLLRHPPCEEFRLLLLLPVRPNNGSESTRGQLGRLLDADSGAGRVLATTLTGDPDNDTAPVYVHAKIAIVDDRWMTIGSANLNEHSLFNDTEMNVVVCDADLVHDTRLRLWSEHTGQPVDALDRDPCAVIDDVWRVATKDRSGTRRLELLRRLSRRTDRLEGPIRGLLVDG